jgi:hypothetical protein
MTILLTNSASSLRILGTLNGFATMFSGLGRAFGPALTGLAFTWGVGNGSVVPAWWFLALLAAIGAIPAWYIVEGDGPSGGSSTGTNNSTDDEEEEEGETGGLLRDSAIVFDSDDDEDLHAVNQVGDSPLLSDVDDKKRGYGAIDSKK